MIISCNVFKDKLEDGRKKQTIRQYNIKQFKRLSNAKRYQLYWHNPRNGGKLIKEVVPIHPIVTFNFRKPSAGRRIPFEVWIDCDQAGNLYMQWFDEKRQTGTTWAQLDGFKDLLEMYNWFYKIYGERLFFIKFMLIRWE